MTSIHPARAALKYLLPPSKIKTTIWGKTNHELNLSSSACSGPWTTDLIPHMRGYLDALDDDSIREVVLQKPTQEAGSETTLVWLKRVAAEDPGPAMWVFADEKTAKRFCESRILVAFRACPAIAPLIDEAKFGQSEIILKNGFSLVMTWASSIAMTASVSIRYLILDEICKPAYYLTQKEGSVLRRIEQRCNRFPNRKIVKLSTVTFEGDNMAQEMLRTDAAYDYNVPCLHCGELQPMAFFEQLPKQILDEKVKDKDRGDYPSTEKTGMVVFSETGNPTERGSTAKYKCRSCDGLWATAEKNKSSGLGQWIPRPNSSPNPRRVGFFVSRLISLSDGGRLETLTEDFLLAKSDPENLQSHYNNALGLHWRQVILKTEEIPITKRKWALPRGVCPERTIALTAGFDHQKRGLWWSVWAHREKEDHLGIESAMIDDGFFETWPEVIDLVFNKQYPTLGNPNDIQKIWRAAVDTGGGEAKEGSDLSMTAEAYHFLRYNGRETIFGTKGDTRKGDGRVRHTIIDKMPGKAGIPIPGGLILYLIDVDKFKGDFFWRVRQDDAGPMPLHFHAETTEAYFSQILSEQEERDSVTGKIKWVKTRENHQLDTAIMMQALIADEWRGGIRLLARIRELQEQDAKQERPRSENNSGWIGSGKSWNRR